MIKLHDTNWFIKTASEIHNDRYDYSCVEYVSIHNKVKIICREHGVFLQTPNNHISKKQNCPKCGIISRTMKNRFNINQFVRKSNNIHGNRYDYSLVNYINAHTKVKIICKEHGAFDMTPGNHSTIKRQGCPTCVNRNSISTDMFINRAYKIHKNNYDYSLVKYIKTHSKVRIICKLHGIFYQTPCCHITLKQGCPKCGFLSSKPENEWLTYLGVPDDENHRQIKIKLLNGRKIKVDGFVCGTNTVYEFWGDYWHGNLLRFNAEDINIHTHKTFSELNKETKIRRTSILESNFNLVEIWETDWNKLKKAQQYGIQSKEKNVNINSI